MVGGYAKGEEEEERKEEDERDSCGQKNQVVFLSDQQVKRDLVFGTVAENFKIVTHTPFHTNAEMGTANRNSAHLLFPAVGMMRIKKLYHYVHLDPSLVSKKGDDIRILLSRIFLANSFESLRPPPFPRSIHARPLCVLCAGGGEGERGEGVTVSEEENR